MKVRSTSSGYVYHDEMINETITVKIDRSAVSIDAPKDGKHLIINTYDDCGLRETGLEGNTHYKLDYNGKWVKREKSLTQKQLIEEIIMFG